MSKRRKQHRQDKLYEKLQSEMGMRIQNRYWREQVKWSKLPILVINDIPDYWDEEAWMEWARQPAQLVYVPPKKEFR